MATEAGLQRAIVQDMLRSSESVLRLAQDRLRIGNGTEQDVAVGRAVGAAGAPARRGGRGAPGGRGLQPRG